MNGPTGKELPQDVAKIRQQIRKFFQKKSKSGLTIGSYYGVYVFFDYDEEPIYVGQSRESLSARVGRHMTNQRTDAVAMNVLDPFEVASIEVYLLHHKKLSPPGRVELAKQLDSLEYTVFQKVLGESVLGAVLNEKNLRRAKTTRLPESYRERIIPEEIYAERKHADVRIARRANTIARLAQVISERNVSAGLRRTLWTQARRLEKLAKERFEPFKNEIPVESQDEDAGDANSSI